MEKTVNAISCRWRKVQLKVFTKQIWRNKLQDNHLPPAWWDAYSDKSSSILVWYFRAWCPQLKLGLSHLRWIWLKPWLAATGSSKLLITHRLESIDIWTTRCVYSKYAFYILLISSNPEWNMGSDFLPHLGRGASHFSDEHWLKWQYL